MGAGTVAVAVGVDAGGGGVSTGMIGVAPRPFGGGAWVAVGTVADLDVGVAADTEADVELGTGVAALGDGEGDWIGRLAVGPGVGETGCSAAFSAVGRAVARVAVGVVPAHPESPASRTMPIKTINATIYSRKIIPRNGALRR